MKTRRKNPDNLYQRNGIWWIRYNADGKKLRRTLGTSSLREAKTLRDEILVVRSARARFGLPIKQKEARVLTFAQVCKKWLDSREANGRLAIQADF